MSEPSWEHDQRFDAGETGCGEILVDLKLFLRAVPSGARVLITAHDAGAPVELPAWCRLSGHALLRAEHPRYLITRK
jgi:tRNA 2-thiouridine synthesizing protein A